MIILLPLLLFSSFLRSYERLLSRGQLIENQRSAHARTYSRGRARRIAAQPQEIRAVIHASWCRNRPRLATAFAHVDDPRSFRLFRACHCLERPANSLISRGGHRLIQQAASRWSHRWCVLRARIPRSAIFLYPRRDSPSTGG